MASMLIVDDEATVRRSIARLLADEGHTLVFAHDVSEAERRLNTEPFELVVADVNMPGESGIELLRRAKRDHPALAVVMVTAVDDRSVGELAIELGAAAYLVKPFKPTELIVAVHTALQQRAVLGPSNPGNPDGTIQPCGNEAELIACLRRVREIADSESPDRSKRVAYHCAAIGRAMGLHADTCAEFVLSFTS